MRSLDMLAGKDVAGTLAWILEIGARQQAGFVRACFGLLGTARCEA